MFTVEWLKDGVRVHGEAMFGNRTEDVLREAKREARRILPHGDGPDTIRINVPNAKTPLVAKLERFAA